MTTKIRKLICLFFLLWFLGISGPRLGFTQRTNRSIPESKKNVKYIRTCNSFIGQFVHLVEGDVIGIDGGNVISATSFTLLENIKILCKIQIIIYPFLL